MTLRKFLIVGLITMCSSLSAASGFLPDPVVTNDPYGNLDPERFYEVACEVFDMRMFHGERLEGVIGGVSIDGVGDQYGYTYHYYLQDVLDMCLLMRSI